MGFSLSCLGSFLATTIHGSSQQPSARTQTKRLQPQGSCSNHANKKNSDHSGTYFQLLGNSTCGCRQCEGERIRNLCGATSRPRHKGEGFISSSDERDRILLCRSRGCRSRESR